VAANNLLTAANRQWREGRRMAAVAEGGDISIVLMTANDRYGDRENGVTSVVMASDDQYD